jgi:hypothetical protein
LAGIDVEPVGETHEKEGSGNITELFVLFDRCGDTYVEENHPWHANLYPNLMSKG